ncbi:hypothetical protein HFC70_04670 [Agrobacterium sp. a22-2]|uniref:hypothetical protein n=1 Tax=Agrobacterium sp. a22-2 TaxID=2283840 RepID=UPI001444D8FA|nr:hypothetical protein [Agrobacterium sp. a22-2]NKN35645.1 hypothetical protein [Agrobacterium sp. a22-2]
MKQFLMMASALSLFLASAVLAIGSFFVATGSTTASSADPSPAAPSAVSATPASAIENNAGLPILHDASTIRRVGPRFYTDPEKALDLVGRD